MGFQEMLMIIGGRYLTFASMFGMRIYWILGAILGLSAYILFKLQARLYFRIDRRIDWDNILKCTLYFIYTQQTEEWRKIDWKKMSVINKAFLVMWANRRNDRYTNRYISFLQRNTGAKDSFAGQRIFWGWLLNTL